MEITQRQTVDNEVDITRICKAGTLYLSKAKEKHFPVFMWHDAGLH